MLQENTTTSEIPPLTLGVTMGFVLPVLQQAIVEGRASDDSAHEAKQLDIDRTANVVDAAVGALGAVGSILPWTQYQQLLGQYLRLMARHADTPAAKPVLRAVCALLDAFHFLAADQGDKLDAAAANMEGDVDEIMSDEDEDAVPEAPTSAEAPSAVLPAREEVFRMLVRRVVPELRDQLVAKGKVRAPVARALVKVLKLLPEELMRLELPRTLQLVANLLKNRIQSARDDARVVLVDMATELGPEYLPFVIEVMRSALPDYGFTAHVLGYTMHAVLEGVAPEAANMPGSIDDCLPMIIPILEASLFQRKL